MHRSVFYSWQSDTNAATNRYFLEDVLKRALKVISNDDSETLTPVIDRDTAGLSGSPSIADSIFAKITQADVFVADVTIINRAHNSRPTPNPNVLVELGFAIAQLGWERILLMQNIAHGEPEELPFDLRSRRTVTYKLPSGTDKASVRNILLNRIDLGLRAALNAVPQSVRHAGPNTPLWWGKWNTDLSSGARAGHLFIREVGARGFLFDLIVISGAHTGQASSYAQIVSSDLAYARLQPPDGSPPGEIRFQRKFVENMRILELEETASCKHFRGMRVYFAGRFVREQESLFTGGYLDELDLQRLYSITGPYYEDLVHQFQNISVSSPVYSSTLVLGGGVSGLYQSRRGILIRGAGGELWASFLKDGVIRYFTTQSDAIETPPTAIKQWQESFENADVIPHPNVDRVPKRP